MDMIHLISHRTGRMSRVCQRPLSFLMYPISRSGLTIVVAYCLFQSTTVPAQETQHQPSTVAHPEQLSQKEGPQAQIQNDKDFWLVLPRQPGLEVAKFESEGIPFCSVANRTPNTKEFPQATYTYIYIYICFFF
ncbi:hypothetical protein BX666DRAFT_1997797 [Dichotomocladium elegans]|nr:hypothetical protein BX666DRAFT_1997797 [Dichotomocladium elegans]